MLRLRCYTTHAAIWPGNADTWTWPGLTWEDGLAWSGQTRRGRPGMTSLALPGQSGPGLVWAGLVRPGLARYGLAWSNLICTT